jgi:hypothetical protein
VRARQRQPPLQRQKPETFFRVVLPPVQLAGAGERCERLFESAFEGERQGDSLRRAEGRPGGEVPAASGGFREGRERPRRLTHFEGDASQLDEHRRPRVPVAGLPEQVRRASQQGHGLVQPPLIAAERGEQMAVLHPLLHPGRHRQPLRRLRERGLGPLEVPAATQRFGDLAVGRRREVVDGTAEVVGLPALDDREHQPGEILTLPGAQPDLVQQQVRQGAGPEPGVPGDEVEAFRLRSAQQLGQQGLGASPVSPQLGHGLLGGRLDPFPKARVVDLRRLAAQHQGTRALVDRRQAGQRLGRAVLAAQHVEQQPGGSGVERADEGGENVLLGVPQHGPPPAFR